MPGNTKDLTNQRFGRLVAIYPTKKRSKGERIIWLCHCDCGNLTEVASNNLLTGHTKSCGCLWKEWRANNKLGLKHGDARTRLYRIWKGMKARCLNSKNHAYKYYGGKGVSVCNEWINNYMAFKFWALLSGYADDLTIDKIDNRGNYEPGNCQWITQSENSKKSNVERR